MEGEETGWGKGTDSVPLRRRMRNCSGERMARHSSSLLCLPLFPDAIAGRRERGRERSDGGTEGGEQSGYDSRCGGR
jgi:hypothetical protein